MSRSKLICILKNHYYKVYRIYYDLLGIDLYEFNSITRLRVKKLRNKYFNDLCYIYKIIKSLDGE